jgi:hypothetical protein
MQGFVTFGAGAQLGSAGFSTTGSEPLYAEQKTWTADYSVETGLEFEAGGAGRVWRDLFIGATYSRFHDSRPSDVTAQIPHPFFFNQPRTISGESEGLPHDEDAIHVSAAWIFGLGRRLEVGIFGGPSAIRVTRDLLADVEFTEEYPYDTATFSRATSEPARKVGYGAHGGFDLTWLLSPQVGIGATLRYSRAAVDLPVPGGGSTSFDAGGLQAAATVKLRILAPARRPARPAPPPDAPRGVPPPGLQLPVPGILPSAVVTATAPVFLRPDATLTPLRQLQADTPVRVLDEAGDWIHIEFDDRQFGRRVAYIQRKFVRLEPRR